MQTLIQSLVEAFGPSGFEDAVRDLIRAAVAPYVDSLQVDALGNLIAHKQGDGSGLTVMIAAHMDEIGLMVTHITQEGYLKFTNIGGVMPHYLGGGRVLFADGRQGVIASERNTDRTKMPGLEDHFIDVGASSQADCPVSVGAPAIFWRPFLAQGDRYIAKSMDDRVGCAVAIEALRRLTHTPHSVYFVFTVQEEIGVRGASTSANHLRPDVGLALDVTLTGDLPKAAPMAVKLGAGPAIKVKDAGMIAHAGLVRLIQERAQAAALPYQLEVLTGGSTDAMGMQIAGPGCAAGCISIPCRFVHSPSEMVDAHDVENAVRLLVELLSNPITL